jgi:LPS-assembly lipoprotein
LNPTDPKPPAARRRAWLAGAAGGALLLATLSGCGFALKRPPELQLKRVQLRGFAALSPMADELRRQLRTSPGVALVERADAAEVVLEALGDTREQVVAASTTAGQVRELTLRARLRFRAYTPSGHELIPATELLLSRDMSYTETAALAKDYEAQIMFRAMQGDLANQVLRRLAALTPDMAHAPAAATAPQGASAAASADAPPDTAASAAPPPASGPLPAGW